MPTDPYDGKELRYRLLPDGAMIYCLGPNLRDDGGTLSRQKPIPPDTDLGFRLWDVKHRRQPPRPKANLADMPPEENRQPAP